MRRSEFDIAVVGGGIVGAAIAFGAAGPGRRIVMLDEGDVALRASRGNFALVWVHGKGLGRPDYARWSARAVRRWRSFADDLAAETGTDVGLEQRGGLLLFLDGEGLTTQAAACRRIADDLGADAFPVEVLDHAATARLLPAIGPEVVGATFCPLDGHVNVLRLFGALHEGCRRRDVDYRPGAKVAAISREPGGGYRLDTAAGTVAAARVVLAAGLGNARLAPMLGLSAPVLPERGQILVTERTGRLLDYPTGTVRQTDEGSVMIGASKERVGFDTGTETEVLAELAASAVRMFPVLASLAVVRSWGALRVMTPDGLPIYAVDPSGTAFLATCHSGITLASVHAGEIAAAVAGGPLPDVFAQLSPERFADVQAA